VLYEAFQGNLVCESVPNYKMFVWWIIHNIQVCVQSSLAKKKSFYLFSYCMSYVKIYHAMVAILDLRSVQKHKFR